MFKDLKNVLYIHPELLKMFLRKISEQEIMASELRKEIEILKHEVKTLKGFKNLPPCMLVRLIFVT